MTAVFWNWTLAIVGTVASMAGVVFSWMAWIQAKGAKEAAQEASSAARTKHMAWSAAEWVRVAKDLHKAIQDVQFSESRRIATDLLGCISHAAGRQTGTESDRVRFEEVVRLLDFVDNYLGEEEVFAEKRDQLLSDTRTIYRRLSELAGVAEMRVEGL